MKTLLLCLGTLLVSGSAANAAVITFDAVLTGPSEVPPNASPGVGFALVTLDTSANTLEVEVTFSGLLGTTTASHIQCCTAVADTGTAIVATQIPTFMGFPLGVTSGTYDHVFDLTLDSTYNPAFETTFGGTAASAEAALAAGMEAQLAYLNIDTTVVPGGEISGFLVQTPEPASFLFVGGALIGIAVLRRASIGRGSIAL